MIPSFPIALVLLIHGATFSITATSRNVWKGFLNHLSKLIVLFANGRFSGWCGVKVADGVFFGVGVADGAFCGAWGDILGVLWCWGGRWGVWWCCSVLNYQSGYWHEYGLVSKYWAPIISWGNSDFLPREILLLLNLTDYNQWLTPFETAFNTIKYNCLRTKLTWLIMEATCVL